MLFKMTLHLLAKAQYGDRQPQAHVTCLARICARILRGRAATRPRPRRASRLEVLE